MGMLILIYGTDLPDGNYYQVNKDGRNVKDSFQKVLIHQSFTHTIAITGRYCLVTLNVQSIIANHQVSRVIVKENRTLSQGYHTVITQVSRGYDAELASACVFLWQTMYYAITSPKTWLFFALYGYCFGVELTVDNIIAEYFYDRFNLNLTTAGTVAAASGLTNLFSRPIGGFVSDKVARRFGMRGRLWYLWGVQTFGGLMCILLGKMSSLAAAICTLIIFTSFVQAACGATFGIVPFISRRSLGGVIGFTAAGGNVGSVLTQSLFFSTSAYTTEQGLVFMGLMIIGMTTLVSLVYFPMWGGMFFPPRASASEEEYYVSEWNPQEQRAGLHIPSLKFAINARCERRREPGTDVVDPELDDPDRSGLSMFKSYSH